MSVVFRLLKILNFPRITEQINVFDAKVKG